MRKVLSQWKIGKYTALELDDDISLESHKKYRIKWMELK